MAAARRKNEPCLDARLRTLKLVRSRLSSFQAGSTQSCGLQPVAFMDFQVCGDRELDVMGVLWELGSGTVAEVREQLPTVLAYTTVLTILRNLEEKGFVSHEAEGRAYRYIPRLTKQAVRQSAVVRLVNTLFQRSDEQLLMHILRERKLSAEALTRVHHVMCVEMRREP